MANLNRKERRAQRNESNTIGMLLRLFFGLSFIGLAVVLFGELDLNYVFSIFTADIIVSLIYGGAIVYLAVFNSTKTMLTNQD